MTVPRETSPRVPSIVDGIIGAATKPARDRTERFAARMDAHLAGLPDDAQRLVFCEHQLQHWITLYGQWAQAVDSGRLEVRDGDATAWDYNFTIAAISQRKARYAPVQVPA